MHTLKKIFYYTSAIVTFIFCVFGIATFFISDSFFEKLLANGLHLKITPEYIGGEIAQDFFDDSFDDNGSGILCYPLNSDFNEGSLDLLRYTVHKPVFDAKWQQYPEYWQFDLEYRNGSDAVRNIMIYVDIDGNQKGSFKTLKDNAENVEFSPEHPWDYAIQICEGKGVIYDSNKNFVCNAQLSVLKNGKTIIVRIPLQDKSLQKVYTAEQTFHYVITGGFSNWDNGNFIPIENTASKSRGSTISKSTYSALVPCIYDLLDDSSNKESNQKNQLSSFNKQAGTKATLKPICVSMKEDFSKTNYDDFISEIKELNKEKDIAKAEKDKQLYDNAITDKNTTKKQQALLAFNIGKIEEAEALFSEIVKENPNDAISLAYYGSCIASRGGKASVIQAVQLVNEAFVYLDKAVELSPNQIDILMNRASVAKAVPNAVFGKALVGAEDFVKCAKFVKSSSQDLLFSEDDKLFLATLYISAYECYTTAGKETEAMLQLKEAQKIWQ